MDVRHQVQDLSSLGKSISAAVADRGSQKNLLIVVESLSPYFLLHDIRSVLSISRDIARMNLGKEEDAFSLSNPVDSASSKAFCFLFGYHVDLTPFPGKVAAWISDWATATWKVDDMQSYFHRHDEVDYLSRQRAIDEEPVDHDSTRFILSVEIRRRNGKVLAEVRGHGEYSH